MADIEMPQLGETVTEGTITRWFKQVGEQIAEDEVLFEVSTDKVDSEVPSPVSGVLTEILVPEGETVDVGTRLAVVDGEGSAAATPSEAPETTSPSTAAPPSEAPEPAAPEPAAPETTSPSTAAPPSEAPEPASPPTPRPQPSAPASAPGSVPGGPGLVVSPIVRRLLAEHGIDPSAVRATGAGGRITRGDVERAIAEQRPGAGRRPTPPADTAAASAPPSRRPTAGADVAVPLSNIRRMTGEHMRMSRDVAPHAMTAVEVDYEAVERVRQAHREQWRAEEGFSLTYLPFIARAVIDAIEDFPHINATLGDGELVAHGYVNLAIAVDLDFEGLLAPVVRDADQKRLRALAREIDDLARRARSRQLSADEITGGTFTITNAGSYGTHMVIPIINQPQVAILSTDGISRKPVVVTDDRGGESIAIRSTGLLPLSWDHRAFDGAYSAAFLARVREILETRDWEAEL